MGWKRLLKQHAVYGWIAVQRFERVAYVARSCRLREAADFDGYSNALAHFLKVANVGQARFVFTDENDDELGMNTALA